MKIVSNDSSSTAVGSVKGEHFVGVFHGWTGEGRPPKRPFKAIVKKTARGKFTFAVTVGSSGGKVSFTF